jgi:hypothetical protein
VEASNSCAGTLIFSSFFFIVFCQSFLSLFSARFRFFCLAFYCLFSFCQIGFCFYRPSFSIFFFDIVLFLFLWLMWFYLWPTPTCLGLKGLVVVVVGQETEPSMIIIGSSKKLKTTMPLGANTIKTMILG